MADLNVQVSPIFADGQTVELFDGRGSPSWPGVPPSAPLDEAVVTNAFVVFTGVDQGSYFIAAQIDGTWQAISIAVTPDVSQDGEPVLYGTAIGGSSDLSGTIPDDMQLPSDLERTTNKGVANGYAELDGTGRVPTDQMTGGGGGSSYQGTWDASTNTPELADGVGTGGDQYYVATAGTVDLGSGSIAYSIGDFVIYNGTIWQKLGGNQVISVAGKTGAVSLVKADVGLGSVDNTADTAKPVSTAQQTALDAKQPLDTDLTAIAALVSAADRVPYATGSGAWALATLSTFARTVLDDPDAATMRTTLGITASDPLLTAIAALTTSADQLIYTTGSDTVALTSLSTFVRGILGSANASAFRTAISATGTPLAQSDVTGLEAALDAIRDDLTAIDKVVVTTGRALILTDAGKAVDVNSSSAINVFIPQETTVNFPLGSVIQVTKIGTGTTKIVGATGGMIRNPVTETAVDEVEIASRFGSVYIRKQTAPDTWIASGAIA